MMKKSILFLVGLFLCVLGYASNGKYRLILTDDPATTIMIGWEQGSGSNPVVHYGTTDYGITWGSYPLSKTIDRSVVYKGMNNNFTKLIGLTPNTSYYFVINDSEGTSQRFWFKTAPNTNDQMSFISGGDSRNNRTPRQRANRLVAKLKPTAVFFGGDMTNGDTDAEWQDWFIDWQETIASDGRMFPILPTRGNHEATNNSIYNLFNTLSTDVYYNITFGANLYSIYTLNSEITAGGSQYTWLQNELTTDNAIWKSAQYHKPMRPHVGSKSEGNDEYNNWAQLFYDEGVRLVYESDSHTVKTTWPVKPCSSGAICAEGFEREDINGTVYVGEGCWGAPLRSSDDAKIWTRDSASFNQFKWVCVSTSQVTVKTIMIDNEASASENSNSSICQLPAGVDVWNPSNGDIVTLIDSMLQAPSISITSHTNGEYIAIGVNVLITTNPTDADGTIDYVDFIVNGSSIGTDNTAPFEMLHTFADGAYDVKTIVYDNDALTDEDQVTIWVGSFTEQLDIVANDDVEEREGDGNVYSTSSDLELMYDSYDSQGYQTVGVRFTNLNIPPNAIINSAYIQFTADGDYANTTELLVAVEDVANAGVFEITNAFDVSGRTYLSTEYWNVQAWTDGDAGVAQRTPEVITAVQNIVNKPGWSAGNAICIKLEGTGVSLTSTSAKRKAESIDGLAAPVLHIEYEMNPGVLAVNDVKLASDILIFPNPAKDIIYFNLPTTNNIWTVEVYSIKGKRIISSEIKNSQLKIDQLKAGVYFVKVYNGFRKVQHTEKIVVK